MVLMRYSLTIVFNLIMRINLNNQMKSIYWFLLGVGLLMSTTAFAQRTMFGSNNKYVLPTVPFQEPDSTTDGLVYTLDAAIWSKVTFNLNALKSRFLL